MAAEEVAGADSACATAPAVGHMAAVKTDHISHCLANTEKAAFNLRFVILNAINVQKVRQTDPPVHAHAFSCEGLDMDAPIARLHYSLATCKLFLRR